MLSSAHVSAETRRGRAVAHANVDVRFRGNATSPRDVRSHPPAMPGRAHVSAEARASPATGHIRRRCRVARTIPQKRGRFARTCTHVSAETRASPATGHIRRRCRVARTHASAETRSANAEREGRPAFVRPPHRQVRGRVSRHSIAMMRSSVARAALAAMGQPQQSAQSSAVRTSFALPFAISKKRR